MSKRYHKIKKSQRTKLHLRQTFRVSVSMKSDHENVISITNSNNQNIQTQEETKKEQKQNLLKNNKKEKKGKDTQFNSQLLINFLKIIYLGENFDDDMYDQLGNLDKKFITYFFINRILKCDSFKNFDLENFDISIEKNQAKKLYKLLQKEKFVKTTQQQLQFLVKHAFKQMRLLLIDQGVISNHFDHNEFYQFYFGQTAINQNLDIGIFHDPRNSQTLQTRYKTYTKRYVLDLLKSQSFKMDLFQFFQDKIYSYYQQIAQFRFQQTINKLQVKIDKLISQQEEFLFNESVIFNFIDQQMKQELLLNKQNKLPWLKEEIRQAIYNFINIVDLEEFSEEHLRTIYQFKCYKESFQINYFNNSFILQTFYFYLIKNNYLNIK